MTYDFSSVIDRRGKDSIAVEPTFLNLPPLKDGFDIIPMWVADMNFAVVPTVQEEIIRRAQHPCFGYFSPREEYLQAIVDWQTRRHGMEGLEKKHIGYENGVLGGVVSALNILCSQGDKVLLHSPTYIGFTSVLENNGYHAVHSPLVKDEEGVWRMDFEDMERRIKKERIHAMILCSPHNPCGRVWERRELEKVYELCEKYDIYVVDDEIWSDLIRPDVPYISPLTLGEAARRRTMGFFAPSKTFSLAGLVGSYHIVFNDRLRERLEKESSLSHYNNMNVLSMYGLIGAYKPEGYVWVDELNEVIKGNVDFAVDYIRTHFEGVEVCKPQGTYMLFIDCGKWLEKHSKTMDELMQAGFEVGVLWQDGRSFFHPTSIRLNLALPLSRVQEAFYRLDKYVFNA